MKDLFGHDIEEPEVPTVDGEQSPQSMFDTPGVEGAEATPELPARKPLRYVMLGQEDKRLAFQLAVKRHEFDTPRVRSQKVSATLTEFEATHIGVIGEVAAAKFLCVPVPRDTSYAAMKDYDLVWLDSKIQVKANNSRYYPNKLHGRKILKFKEVKPDLFMLVVPDVDKVADAFKTERWLIAGWCTFEFYKNNHGEYDFGYGPEPSMDQDQLWHPDEMLRLDKRVFKEMWTSDDDTGDTYLFWKVVDG